MGCRSFTLPPLSQRRAPRTPLEPARASGSSLRTSECGPLPSPPKIDLPLRVSTTPLNGESHLGVYGTVGPSCSWLTPHMCQATAGAACLPHYHKQQLVFLPSNGWHNKLLFRRWHSNGRTNGGSIFFQFSTNPISHRACGAPCKGGLFISQTRT